MTKSEAEQSAETIIHLARLAQSGGGGSLGLTPAQWTALRFFSRANRFSRTPSAFSEFNATTRGTASQTVKSLVSLGLLERHRSESDKRSIRFELTDAGHAALREDPLNALIAALDGLGPETGAQVHRVLQDVALQVAAAREAPRFGTCSDCCYLEGGAAEGGYCHCAAASLQAEELGALCVDFAPRAANGSP